MVSHSFPGECNFRKHSVGRPGAPRLLPKRRFALECWPATSARTGSDDVRIVELVSSNLVASPPNALVWAQVIWGDRACARSPHHNFLCYTGLLGSDHGAGHLVPLLGRRPVHPFAAQHSLPVYRLLDAERPHDRGRGVPVGGCRGFWAPILCERSAFAFDAAPPRFVAGQDFEVGSCGRSDVVASEMARCRHPPAVGFRDAPQVQGQHMDVAGNDDAARLDHSSQLTERRGEVGDVREGEGAHSGVGVVGA